MINIDDEFYVESQGVGFNCTVVDFDATWIKFTGNGMTILVPIAKINYLGPPQ